MYTIYGMSHCNYCTKAVELLESLELPYSYASLDDENILTAYVQLHQSIPKSVPQVYYNDEHIGGYDRLREYLAAA